MTAQSEPYGMSGKNGPRCVNAEPGTFSHECGKSATWIGTKASGWRGCYCDDCKADGFEARGCKTWSPLSTSLAAE